jgi:hypothetical protein
MPIALRVPVRRLSQREFGEIAFEVMRHVFAIHHEIGRFFDETIYKCALAQRLPNVRLEEPIDIRFDSFHKPYFGIAFYEEAITHFFGGETQVNADVAVQMAGHVVGHQRVRLLAPGVAFKITGLNGPLTPFEEHARRLLAHSDLRAIAWVNVNMNEVTFTTLER